MQARSFFSFFSFFQRTEPCAIASSVVNSCTAAGTGARGEKCLGNCSLFVTKLDVPFLTPEVRLLGRWQWSLKTKFD